MTIETHLIIVFLLIALGLFVRVILELLDTQIKIKITKIRRRRHYQKTVIDSLNKRN